MRIILLSLFFIFLSGCTPIRVVEELPEDGQCEKLMDLTASGKSIKEIQSKLEGKTEKSSGNLLLFKTSQFSNLTASQKPFTGKGTAYKCTYN